MWTDNDNSLLFSTILWTYVVNLVYKHGKYNIKSVFIFKRLIIS